MVEKVYVVCPSCKGTVVYVDEDDWIICVMCGRGISKVSTVRLVAKQSRINHEKAA